MQENQSRIAAVEDYDLVVLEGSSWIGRLISDWYIPAEQDEALQQIMCIVRSRGSRTK